MAEEETDGIAMGKKLGDNDFYQNETKESLVSPSSSSSSSSSSVSHKNQTYKGKTCKGCLYFSSAIKSTSGDPVCYGLTRSVLVTPGIDAARKIEAARKGRVLRDFEYACIGYSIYPDLKYRSPHIKDTELPICSGIVIIEDKVPDTAYSASTQPRNKEDGTLTPVPVPVPVPAPSSGSRKPAPSFGSEFMTRFTRNAGLVAMGVAKNLKRVGNQIKDSVDDVLYPYRRRPK